LFSAAIPGQIGTGHVNLQLQSQWADRFVERGYQVVDIVRPTCWSDERVEYWYRQNAIVYVHHDRHDVLDRAPSIARTETPLDLVHPDMHAYWVRRALHTVSVGEALSLLAVAVRRAGRRRWDGVRHANR
jgi:hypothetical protein